MSDAFAKRIIIVTMCSREPFDFEDLHEIATALDKGTQAVGGWEETEYTLISGKEMVEAIKEYEQEREDLGLDDEGNDLEEESSHSLESIIAYSLGTAATKDEVIIEHPLDGDYVVRGVQSFGDWDSLALWAKGKNIDLTSGWIPVELDGEDEEGPFDE